MKSKLEEDGGYNWFEGKWFKIMRYNEVEEVIKCEVVEISWEEEFNRVVEKIKEFNNGDECLGGLVKKYKKVISEWLSILIKKGLKLKNYG